MGQNGHNAPPPTKKYGMAEEVLSKTTYVRMCVLESSAFDFRLILSVYEVFFVFLLFIFFMR